MMQNQNWLKRMKQPLIVLTNKLNDMRKFLLSAIMILLSIGLYAQMNDTIQIKESPEEVKDSTNEFLLKEIVKNENQIKDLQTLLNLKDETIGKLKNDSVELQKQIAGLQNESRDLQSQKVKSETELRRIQKDFDQLKKDIASKDAVIYKQCILYPLERRFNQQFIDDALETASIFTKLGTTSEKFNAYRATYEPLLEKYGEYNQQIMDFLLNCVSYIERREEKHVEVKVAPDMWSDNLLALPYYNDYYVGKDNPPYKSIIYLDERIDEIKEVLKSSDNLKLDLKKIIAELEPKTK